MVARAVVVAGAVVAVPGAELVVPVATRRPRVVAVPAGAGVRERVVAVAADRLHIDVLA